MPKEIHAEEFDFVLRAVERFPAGASVQEIGQVPRPPLARRTLQRRLALLAAQDRVHPEGEGRASRYRIRLVIGESAPTGSREDLQVSRKSLAIRNAVRARIHERRPVSYQRSFLDGYRPNESAYFPPALRQHLAAEVRVIAVLDLRRNPSWIRSELERRRI